MMLRIILYIGDNESAVYRSFNLVHDTFKFNSEMNIDERLLYKLLEDSKIFEGLPFNTNPKADFMFIFRDEIIKWLQLKRILHLEYPETQLSATRVVRYASFIDEVTKQLDATALVVTHSYHLVDRLGAMIESSEYSLSEDDVEIRYFVGEVEHVATFDERGVLQNWIGGFMEAPIL